MRFGFAAMFAGVAVGLQWAIQPWVGSRVPFLFILPMLLLAANLFGRGPSAIVLLAGLVNGAYWMAPVGQMDVSDLPDRISLLAYMVVGTLLAFFGGRLRLVSDRAADAERRLGLAQENTGVGLFEIDLINRTIFASPALWRLVGRTPGNTGGSDTVSLDEWNAGRIPAEVEEGRAALKRNADRGVSVYEREHRVRLPDGSMRWLMSKVHIERSPEGRAVRLRGASVDVTERKRIDDLLARTRAELQQQVADLQQLHALSSRLLELTDIPRQLHAILETLVDLHASQGGAVILCMPDGGPLEIGAVAGLSEPQTGTLKTRLDESTPWHVASTERRRVVQDDHDAAFRPLADALGCRGVHCTPLAGPGGEILGVITLFFDAPHRLDEREIRLADICARKAAVFIERFRAQVIATERDQRFRVALESSAVPFTVLAPVRNRQSRIVDFRWSYINTAAARTMHRPPTELIGQQIREVLPGTWDEPGLFDAYVSVAEQGVTREFELRSEANGIIGWFHVVASPLQHSVAVWFADVTDRKRQEEALREADQRKDEFLATLAHELRNPLAPIRQAALISKSPTATDAQKRWSHEVIDRQVQHMAILLDDLLDVSRITRGKLHLRKEHTELAAVVDAAVETARPLIDLKHHHLIIDLPPRPVHIEADRLRLAQVLANLLTNAAKYTDAGGRIRIDAAVQEGELTIRVTDNGIGIRPDALAEVFQMFTQVRPSHDRAGGGLGIGLALARALVEMHGGTITANSRGPGQGSEFTVQLPAFAAEEAASPGAVPAAPAETMPASAAPLRILVADDNRDGAQTLATFLRMEGHDVQVGFDGEEALAVFTDFRPHAVLLDIGMPKLTGDQVARRIRALPEGHDTILIAITGWGQDKDRRQALDAGFDHHLTKPVDLQKLGNLIDTAKLTIPASTLN
ncbi:ATP-binding protein [Noviherbaspirillum sp.]|uniref:ATP-binding protein n=1 Tax=Noviherbaspirillum sp. TaxID=1926288 RepID=UPI002FE031EB